MTVAITCSECSGEVTFLINGEEMNPREECECGQMYELQVKKIGLPENKQ